jgi:hypothetical protein
VLRDWAEAHREGASVERLEALADRWLASPHAIQLEHDGKRPHLGGARHSTPEMLAVEDRVITNALRRRATATQRNAPPPLTAGCSPTTIADDTQASGDKHPSPA